MILSTQVVPGKRRSIPGTDVKMVDHLRHGYIPCPARSGGYCATGYLRTRCWYFSITTIWKKGGVNMEYSPNIALVDLTGLDEELIEITPVANYEESDAQDLPETGASQAN